MTSELSIFAAQLREFINFQSEESAFGAPLNDDSLAVHSDAEFNGYAMVLFALQFKANAPYGKFCEARGITPNGVTHWKQIPAVPTSAFKELEFSCLLPEQRTKVFHSSGTTEQRPSRHFYNTESLAVYEVSLWPWFERYILNDFRSTVHHSQLVILAPPPMQVPHSSLVHMFETVRRKLEAPESVFVGRISSDNTWTLDFDAALAALNARHATLLLGTAFSFIHLLDYLAEQNLHFELPPGSCVMETGGYKGRSRTLPRTELHKLITQRLGVPPTRIVCEYGMSELSSQAYDLKIPIQNLERKFRFPPWVRAQIISPETGHEVAEGETGLIRVFDLANVFSVMAVQTEDLGVRRSGEFELLGRAVHAEPRGCSLMTV